MEGPAVSTTEGHTIPEETANSLVQGFHASSSMSGRLWLLLHPTLVLLSLPEHS